MPQQILISPRIVDSPQALDDCVSLRQVMVAAAAGLDLPMPSLLARFAQELDLPSSLAQIAVLTVEA